MRIEIRYVNLFSYAPRCPSLYHKIWQLSIFLGFQDPCDRSSPFFAVHCWESVSGFLVLGRDSKISTKSYVGICRAEQRGRRTRPSY